MTSVLTAGDAVAEPVLGRGNRVPVITQLMQTDEDTVRDVINGFNQIGLASLDPQWARGRPRQLSPDDGDFVIQTATTRPAKLDQPFTRWSIRKLAPYPHRVDGRAIRVGRAASFSGSIVTFTGARGIASAGPLVRTPPGRFCLSLAAVGHAANRRGGRGGCRARSGPFAVRQPEYVMRGKECDGVPLQLVSGDIPPRC
ncbi:helix-turn-helix domain-containing protein [Streptomyces niveus]|uniref:helix-turn-helix domain-containing protein n=1 Tax=Streptomyces niveus TaxID=193462 RepID=UPI003CFC52ED